LKSILQNKFFQSPSGLVDMFLFLALLFSEDLTRNYFPSNMLTLDSEELSVPGAYMLIVTGILGWVAFFTRIENPKQTEMKNLFSTGISKFISVIGGLLATIITCIMFMTGIFKFNEDIYNSDSPLSDKESGMLITAFFVLFGFFMMLVLPAVYYGWRKKLRAIHPTLRYALLLPAIYFVTAAMNEYVLEVRGLEMNSFINFIKISLSYIGIFCLFFMAPRMFANAQTLDKSDWYPWLMRFLFFFIASYYDINLNP